MLGHHPPAREKHLMAFRWWADDGPHIVALDSFSPSHIMNKEQQQQKVVINVVGPPSDKSCLGPRMTNTSLVDRNYKSYGIHYFFIIDADISLHYRVLNYHSFSVNVKIIFRTHKEILLA